VHSNKIISISDLHSRTPTHLGLTIVSIDYAKEFKSIDPRHVLTFPIGLNEQLDEYAFDASSSRDLPDLD
jgi:hypothetical protein